jgi:leucyl aminopeptidase (aminopeptidase T)
MNIEVGTETRDEYYSMELAHAAHKLVTKVRPVQPGQQVLISADTASDSRVVWATAKAVYAVGGVPTVVWHPKLPATMQAPPAPLGKAVTGADIWFDYAVAYLQYGPAYFSILEHGGIYVALTGMDVDMMVRTIGRPTYPPMKEMAKRLYELSQAADTIRVTNPAGSDLYFQVDQDLFDPPWEPEGHQGYPQMLGGQSWFNVLRENVEGVLVFDGVIWPPEELGVLRTPVRLVIEGGYIRKVEGEAEARFFARWLESFDHPAVYLIDHACYGFNPGVLKPSGRILEDERVFGCMQFGIGATPKHYGSPAHTDGVCLSASVWLDDVQIADTGRYILPELVELCRAMGAPGY